MDNKDIGDADAAVETQEWLQSLDEVLARSGPERVCELFQQLSGFAQMRGVRLPFTANTPYINTIPLLEQPPYPGDLELEYRIGSIIRWNAMAMVVKANRAEEGIGGHIATYASIATLYEVGFNHFFRGNGPDRQGDLVTSRGTPRPAFTRAPSWRGACRWSRRATSVTSCTTGRASPPIRTPG